MSNPCFRASPTRPSALQHRDDMPTTQTPSTLLFLHGAADLYGSDIALLQLVSGLDRDWFRSIVVVPYDGPLIPLLRNAGAEVIIRYELPILRRQHMNQKGLFKLATSSVGSIRWLMELIDREDVDLVHSNTLAVLIPGFAAKLARRPHVWHVHEILTHPQIVAWLLATLSSAMSTLVIASSKATARHYCQTRFATSTPARAILNGIDESRVRGCSGTSLRSLIGADSRDVVFALIGRINHLKGHSVFLDAAEHLASELQNVRFLIVGDSFAGQERFSEAVDGRLKSSDILRGKAIRLEHIAEIGNVYQAVDVVVVPSVEPESFGLTAAEAMAAGLPVIAARIGALPEVVDDGCTGILVNPGDPVSLSVAMEKLSGSPSLRTRMGREGRRRYARCFRVERYVEEFGRVYEELLSGNWDHEIADSTRQKR